MRRHPERAWMDFAEWCRGRRLKALPAHPWTVAVFARWCEPRLPIMQILRDLRVIARVHLLAGHAVPDRHPTVRRTLRAIEARQRARRQGAALFRAEDFAAHGETIGMDEPSPDRGPRRRRRIMRGQPKLTSRRP